MARLIFVAFVLPLSARTNLLNEVLPGLARGTMVFIFDASASRFLSSVVLSAWIAYGEPEYFGRVQRRSLRLPPSRQRLRDPAEPSGPERGQFLRLRR